MRTLIFSPQKRKSLRDPLTLLFPSVSRGDDAALFHFVPPAYRKCRINFASKISPLVWSFSACRLFRSFSDAHLIRQGQLLFMRDVCLRLSGARSISPDILFRCSPCCRRKHSVLCLARYSALLSQAAHLPPWQSLSLSRCCSSPFGVLFGSIFSSRQVGGVSSILINIAAWLSGIWIPIDLIGGAFRTVC